MSSPSSVIVVVSEQILGRNLLGLSGVREENIVVLSLRLSSVRVQQVALRS